MISLSIIIPIYKVESYIRKCIYSCEKQDIPKDIYEIICVDDGSPDASGDIADRIATEYCNIKVIHRANGGLSEARNTGLDAAQGEYVWFVDSDDWIADNCLSEICEKMKGHDVLALSYILAYDDKTKNSTVCYKYKGVYSGIDVYCKGRFTQAQMYIYRRDFLVENNLKFYPGIYHEDSEFNPRFLYKAKTVNILERPVYYFYKRPNSITTCYNPKRIDDLFFVINRLLVFRDSVEDYRFRERMQYYISMTFNTMMTVVQNGSKEDRKKLDSRISESSFILKSLLKSSSVKHKLEGVVMYLCCGHYSLVYRLFK